MAVRTLVSRVSWLDGSLFWHDEGVGWHRNERTVFAGPDNIARTQRALNKIGGYRGAARQVLGDWEGWLAAKRDRLALAKQLSQVSCTDLRSLVSRVLSQNTEAISRVALLITVEALSVNEMPCSPSAVLLAAGESAAADLRLQCDNTRLPLEARLLAALSLGAICRAEAKTGLLATKNFEPSGKGAVSAPALRRAYRYGLKWGLPPEPATVAYFLREDDGERLTTAYRSAKSRAKHFTNLDRLARELRAEGISPQKLVSVFDALANSNHVAELLWTCKEKPTDSSFVRRRQKADRDTERRAELVAEFVDCLTVYAARTGEPKAIEAAANFVRHMLRLGPWVPELTDTTFKALRAGNALDPAKACAYVSILTDKHEALWDKQDIPKYVPGREKAMFGSWVFRRWVISVKPLVDILDAGPDEMILRLAIDLHVHQFLCRYTWPDTEMLLFILGVIREVDYYDYYGRLLSLLEQLSHCFPDVASARESFRPLLSALSQLSREDRSEFLPRLLDKVEKTHKKARKQIATLTRALPTIAAMRASKSNWYVSTTMFDSALILHEEVGAQWPDWLVWLANHIDQMDDSKFFTYPTDSNMTAAVALAAALADGNCAQFQKIVTAVHKCGLGEHFSIFEQGMQLFKGLPVLHELMSQAIIPHARRCAEIVVKLGVISGLGPNAQKPLHSLEALWSSKPTIGEEWNDLLTRAPELSGLVEEYCKARNFLGQSSSPPDSVEQALGQHSKLLRELTHLEARIQKEPNRPGLTARANNLRSYLANETGLESYVLDLARERLSRATVDSQLQVAEKQTSVCFMMQLCDVAGPLPDSLKFDRYMLNAILLTVDITCNRRLLKQLIRAVISEDHGWRQRQPGNQTFLCELSNRGVNVEMWMAQFPRRYRLPAITGGTIKLFLETDPLKVLEMGNYFDTCLSYGRENSFATVANACELNKRVAFAADHKGRIVGRKLIGIEKEGALVGFRTYTSLSDEPSNRALRAIFRKYLTDFAEHCGLTLADDGIVVPIVAKFWYDDGTVGWAQDAESEFSGTHGHTR